MRHWTIIEQTYLYDGTVEGVLTIAYLCFKEKQIPTTITSIESYIGNLFDQPKTIITNLEYSTKVVDAVLEKLSSSILYYVYTAFCSANKTKENTIIRYLVYAFKYGKNIDFMKSIDCVLEIQQICKNVKGEAHRLLGFLRFRELSNRFLYAEYESDNDVLLFIAEHFEKRLSQEIWMIHDRKREQIALYNRKEFVIVDASTLDTSAVETSQEDVYLRLWKEYFRNITIKERENKRCQRQFMPKKYWKYLPEVSS